MNLAEARKVVWDEPGWLAGVGHALGELLPRLSPALPIGQPCQVLEVGCGIGRILFPLAAALPEARCHGVDSDEAMVAAAWMVNEHLGLANVTVWDGDGATLPFSGRSMLDAIYSLLTFQHLPDETCAGYVAEMCHVLRPGGVAVVQWVEGDHHAPMDHRRDVETVHGWWPDWAVLSSLRSERDMFQEEWWWTTATMKQSDG